MTHILLYWNHICVLHRQEKAFCRSWPGGCTGKTLSWRFVFRLGIPGAYVGVSGPAGCGAPRPHRFGGSGGVRGSGHFSKMEPELYPAADWVSLRESPALDAVRRATNSCPRRPSLWSTIPASWGYASRCGCRTGTGWPSAGSTTLPSRR